MNQDLRVERESGFTLVEVALAASFLFIAVLMICQLFAIMSRHFLLNERQRNAEAQVGAVTNHLAAQPVRNVNVGQVMTLTPDAQGGISGVVFIAPCQEGARDFCDLVLVPAPGSATAPGAFGCESWPCATAWRNAAPPGTVVLFARRWNIDALDRHHHLAEMTIAIFPDPTTNQPVALRRTDVVLQ